MVVEVFRKDDLFKGDYLNAAPDIVIVPKDYNYVLDPNKRTSRLCIGSAKDDYPVLSHRDRNGVLFMTGPNVKQGNQIANASIYDLMPTVLHLLGIKSSDNLDGEILSNVFNGYHNEFANKRPKFVPADDISSFIPGKFFHKKVETSAAST